MAEQNHSLLFVDDEISILHSLKRLLRKEGYALFMTSKAEEALEILSKNQIHMIISDQRMPEISGTELLSKVKDLYPDVLRIILSGYTDIDAITESINKGHVYKFFLKPWNDHNLKIEIRKALEQYELIRANKILDQNLSQILKEKGKEMEEQSSTVRFLMKVMDALPSRLMVIDAKTLVLHMNRPMEEWLERNGIRKDCHILSDLFPEEIIETINDCLNRKREIYLSEESVLNEKISIRMIPTDADLKGKSLLILCDERLDKGHAGK